jgi:hydroxypyruvate reductase
MIGPAFTDYIEHSEAVLTAVLSGCDPRRLTLEGLARASIGSQRVHLLAIGKASVPMTLAAGDFLGQRIAFGIATTTGHLARPAGFPATVGLMAVDHPLPTQRNLDASVAIKYVAEDFGRCAAAGHEGLLLVLISGGGSAHLALPAGHLTLEDLVQTTDLLMRSGCTINQINCVRKHIEQLKGGRLAALAHPGKILCLVLSDVVRDPLDVISSGPCVPDPSTYAQALEILDAQGLTPRLPAVRQHLIDGRDGVIPETPKDRDPALANVRTRIIGNNTSAVDAAVKALITMGFQIAEQRAGVTGEARLLGAELATAAVELAKTKSPAPRAIVWGGESTVTVRGDGVGGRNQELALSAAVVLDGHPNIAVFSFATDGVDGPTDAAGALVTGATCTAAAIGGLRPQPALLNNDSHTLLTALEALGHRALFRTGPTGTNVADLAVALVY